MKNKKVMAIGQTYFIEYHLAGRVVKEDSINLFEEE